ncbi:MAG: hypothetical protein IJH65_09550 [Methanobrevibacter sp.]|nr:hypothetical protein [Methanobrevibacter sp.]
MEEDKMDDFLDELYPELTLETDDIIMSLAIKKDYSKIKDFNKRKEEFINDLKAFIEEFSQTQESDDFVRYYED